MINQSLDFYDDLEGTTLKRKMNDFDRLPDFIKTADQLSPDIRNQLPDDVYALVLLDGGRKMRKYACTDKGNTALSVIYFLENHHRLPEEAQKTAAQNLVTACGWYDMQPPAQLEKLALVGAVMGVMSAVDAAKTGKQNMQKMHERMGQGPVKVSELTGSDVMPYSPESTKKASLQPHVDVTGLRPPRRVEHQEVGKFFCLTKEGGARYPIGTASEVEKAAEYFTNYGDRFTPFERHRYCMNLTKRAETLGMKMPDHIRKYGSVNYDPNVKLAIVQRRRYFHQGTSEYGLVNELMDKCASIVPETFAVMLEQFDRQTGLADRWGNGIDAPYFSVYGFEKRANWSFTHSNDHINEDQLKRLSTDVIRREELKRRFGCDMVEEFEKDPIQIFDSLPLEHKRIIMHMASGVEE